ncbi:eCIS core domain-containing protein [Streptomyces sp. BYX5S]
MRTTVQRKAPSPPVREAERRASAGQNGTLDPMALVQLCRAGGNSATEALVQRKTRVSRPGDPHEREAERAAEQVLRTPGNDNGPEPDLTGPPPRITPLRAGGAPQLCQRCATAEHRVGEPSTGQCCGGQVQRQAEEESPQPPEPMERVAGPATNGQPLTDEDRTFFEDRLGRDLSAVRVHTGGDTSATARALRARAYTIGHDIGFRSGEYAPGTPAGRRLLAHELVHVVQQESDGGSRTAVQRATDRQGTAADDSFWPVRAAMYALTGNVVGLVGEVWLHLSREHKEKYLDQALAGATEAISVLPADPALGLLWPLYHAGLRGFVARLRSPNISTAEKIQAMDKIAGVVTGRSTGFNLAFLKGLAKGFFLDGMLGIFLLIRDVWKLVPRLWGVLGQVAHAIGGFPPQLAHAIQGFKDSFAHLSAESVVEQVVALARDPRPLLDAVAGLGESAREIAREQGGNLAEFLVRAVNKPGSEETFGDEAGKAVGQVLWEAVFAVVTAGGGTALTGAKAGLRAVLGVLGKLGGRMSGGSAFMSVFRAVHVALGAAGEWIRKAALVVKGRLAKVGERLGELLGRAREFFALLFRSCHASALRCKLPNFKVPARGKTSELKKLAKELSEQLDIPVDYRMIMEAPWVGRKGRFEEYSNAAGYLRSSRKFWKAYSQHFAMHSHLVGKGKVVTKDLAAVLGWTARVAECKSLIGGKMVHHHIRKGKYVVAIPACLHLSRSKRIH